jgi:restriction system protein
VKAGWLTKKDGRWYLTPEGEEALALPAGDLLRESARLYREWKRGRDAEGAPVPAQDEPEESHDNLERAARQQAYEKAVTLARQGIEEHIRSHGPYALQDLVAELLRGMGYHVREIAPKGRDGGIDIVAYQDPLGTRSPRVQVQVKHTDSKVGPEPVRALAGVITTEGDMGLLVATGGFSPDAKQAARQSHRHVELIDLDRFLQLWDEHYDAIRTQGKAMLPLVRVAFLAPDEA